MESNLCWVHAGQGVYMERDQSLCPEHTKGQDDSSDDQNYHQTFSINITSLDFHIFFDVLSDLVFLFFDSDRT